MNEPELSVVLVSRNERSHIDDCLDSVFDACRGVGTFEVVLVDSNSSDGTVERASDYPISILQIPRDDLCTPGAGRYVGTRVARGEYLLFVDGDMTVAGGWISEALRFLRVSSGVAGVTGHLNRRTVDEVDEVDALRGVALFRADALEEVGSYDPYLESSEDVDLCFRLADAGYSLVRLPVVAARHPERDGFGEPLRRWRNGYFHGVGQAVRKAVRSPRVLVRYGYTLRYPLLTAGWIGLGAAALALGAPTAVGWAIGSVFAFAVPALRNGPQNTAVFAASFLLTLLGLGAGLLREPRAPDDFPVDAVAVKQVHGDVHEGA